MTGPHFLRKRTMTGEVAGRLVSLPNATNRYLHIKGILIGMAAVDADSVDCREHRRSAGLD